MCDEYANMTVFGLVAFCRLDEWYAASASTWCHCLFEAARVDGAHLLAEGVEVLVLQELLYLGGAEESGI